ncbi:MAG: AMP-binding protein [Bacteroidales bacterium]|nr:AMP-binding protein [Bacteroidales bacterium]
MVKRIKEIRDNASRRVSDILADIQSRLKRKNRELPLSDRTIGQWLEKWARECPDKEALVYSDRDLRFTYAQLNHRVDTLAKGFIGIGVTRGTHVGIWATNVPDWLTVMYACAKIGAVCVTVNTNYQQNELEYLCKDADLNTLCIIDRDRDTDFLGMTYKMLPELRECERGKLESSRFPCMKNVVFIGQEKYRGIYNTQELLILGENTDDTELDRLKAQVKCNDVVNMQYTSGTTGFPKGVMLTHRNITNNGFLTGEHMLFSSSDKLCCCVPLFHCFGIVLATMNVITHGCTQIMVERFDPLVVLASIHRERCTSVYGVPTMYIAMLTHPMFKMFNLRSLRVGIMAGALCPIELMREVEDKMFMRVTSVYGLTEASPGMTHTRYEQSFEERCTTVGYEFEHTEVKIIEPGTGRFCDVGEIGEFCNRGYNNMAGYYNNPEATAETIDKDGWLHSGDLGYLDENGNFRVTGRIKDMIIRGGENIYPREIEEFLYHLPGVQDVQVAGLPSKKYGEVVAAYIIPKEGAKLTEELVKDFCMGKISRFKIPKYVFIVEEYPLTGSGKIQKFKLKDIGLKILAERGVKIE